MENKVKNYRWTICGLLFFATTVNYLDRQVLSILAPQLSEQYGWTNTDYANIAAVFQFVYAISMLFAGRFIDKFGTKNGYIIAIVVWSLGAIMHAFSIDIGGFLTTIGIVAIPASILGFMVSRAVLAVGEAGNFPAAIKVAAEYFPKKERALATGIFNSGSNVGAILAPITVPWIAVKWGWEYAFIVIGGIGFLWIIFWKMLYEKPELQTKMSAGELAYIKSDQEAEISDDTEVVKTKWTKLLTYRQTWAFVIGKFLTDGVWWFFLFWLPKYLKAEFNMVDTQIVVPLAILYTMTMVGSIGGGWFPMYFIKKGFNAFDGRMRAMFIIALIPLVVLFAQPLGYLGYWIPVFLIGLGASAHQAWSANIFTTVSDMFPKKSIASIVGIGGMAGGIGGVLVTKIAGALFDYYEKIGDVRIGYTIVFIYCSIAYLLAWSIMKLLVPKYRPITDL
jgi:MFS transporter, ACS family, hexuronate transporter